MATKRPCPQCSQPLSERRTRYTEYGGLSYTWRGHIYSLGSLFSGDTICDYVEQSPTWKEAKTQFLHNTND